MQKLVLDASVVIEYLVTGPHTTKASAFFQTLKDGDQVLVTTFTRVECLNVLWKHVRFHRLPEERARQLIIDLKKMPFQVKSIFMAYERAFEIGLVHQLAIYDSVYLALAEREQCTLVTADRRQASAAEKIGIRVELLSSSIPS